MTREADDEGIPEPVGALASWLAAGGFEVEAEPPSPSFGSQMLVFHDGTVAIRAVGDRGIWSIEVAAPAMTRWYDGDVWAACLDGQDAPTEPHDLRLQARMVRERLEEIRRALLERDPSELQECLFSRHKDRLLRRFGRPESELFAD
jgi:hypothetical protein